ncbi:penicillin-binding transpeptidase domain-containing protein [Streptomyces albiaxialis]|uniref:Penicillin-binding transpeptidase domain-containing protein n=1 Tax=Streptomyces albiaxialis TaxID=329523 RepID=A0ABN2W856_9ACTN
MNKPLRRIAIFCGLLTLALLIRDNWIQFVKADELKEHPKNRRVAIERYSQPRGNIIVDGKSVTGSTEVKGKIVDFKYKRTYKNGKLWSPITGYASQAFGANQLEKLYDPILTGNDDRLFFNRTIDMLTGKQQKGGNVVTTLNAKAQKAAYDALGDKKGAVAAINPKTGAILALANKPSYDPSVFAGMSEDDSKAYNALQKKNNKDDPTLNRALRQTYPPGSTFKVVTAAAGLESGDYDLDGKTDSEVPYRLPQSTTELPNEGNDALCKDASVRVALQWSCNTVFAKMSDKLGNEAMMEQAEKFGFNRDLDDDSQDTPVRPAQSIYPKDNRPQNAQAGIGQASNRATPLQMAMVTSAIANDGKLMKPYMVDQLVAPNLNVVEQTKPKELSQAVSPENAQKLQEGMETVVKEGTGKPGQIPGVTVGGKTGTAQHGENNKDNPYAWFISYAKDGDGSPVAVAVVVESSDTLRSDIAGGKLAAPVAKAVMEAVLDGKQ